MPGAPTSRGCDACRDQKKKCDQIKPKCSRCDRLEIPCTGSGTIRYKFKAVQGVSDGKQRRARRNTNNNNNNNNQGAGSTNLNKTLKKVRGFVYEESPKEPLVSSSLSISPCAFSSTLECNGRLERELMHRWLTRTSWGFFKIPQDRLLLDIYLPRAALENMYLMNGILAMAAADLAYSGQKEYLRPALEYNTKATAAIRPHIRKNNQSNGLWLYAFGLLMAIFNFVMSSQPRALDRLITTLDMLLGASNMIQHSTGESRPDCQLQILSGLDMSAMDVLDAETKTALDRLTTVSHQIRVPTIDDGDESMTAAITTTNFAGNTDVYQIAIAYIKCCFAEEAKGSIKNYCWSITAVVDPKFFKAVKNAEPMALMVVLYLGVLLSRMRIDPITSWWLGSEGRSIVEEVAQILLQSPIAQIPDGREAIAWSRRQVGLPFSDVINVPVYYYESRRRI